MPSGKPLSGYGASPKYRKSKKRDDHLQNQDVANNQQTRLHVRLMNKQFRSLNQCLRN